MVQIKKKTEKNRSKEEKESLENFESLELPCLIEKEIVKNCVIEDIGGFLYAQNEFDEFNINGVKRTSNFFTGYMIPVKETLENVVIEPQLHSRYALGTPFVQQQGQMIYYVELSSAIYTFSFDFDAKFVGKTTFGYQNAGKEVVTDRKQRIEATLEAIKKFLVEFSFGAKKTRFMPVVEWESLAIAVSDDTWTVPSPFSKNYIENAKKKLDKVNYNTKLFVYPEQGNFEEVISLAMDEAKRRI
ncbi:MAG: DevR family CRISPR-associated autoregulator [Archaeoglobales archaeon]|nr:DevR family CRISPR-associated autoregulator [Archaeoglobales archaeon]